MPGFLEFGNKTAPILVVLDPPSQTCVKEKRPISWQHYELFAKTAKAHGFGPNDFAFMTCGPYVPEDLFFNKTKCNKFLKTHRSEFLDILSGYEPKMILSLGSWSANMLAGRSVKITTVRGQAIDYRSYRGPVFHSFGIGYVMRSPNLQQVFSNDFRRLKQIADNGYNLDTGESFESLYDYQWCTDLTDWLNDRPRAVFYDTEGTGLAHHRPEVFPFTAQLCREPGKAIMIPVQEWYFPELERDHKKLMKQLKTILEDEKVRKASHNIKYDYHMTKKLGISLEGWAMDTMQAAHAVNENMVDKSQSECVRMYIPEMAGYSDEFDREVDKSQMIHVEKEKLLRYGCGDADSGFRLAQYFRKKLSEDRRQLFLFEQVQMPALREFADSLETNGVWLSTESLEQLGEELACDEERQYSTLIKHTPGIIKKAHLDAGKPLTFTRPDFIRDILFTKGGFGLKPVNYTKSTAKLKDPSQRVASTGGKEQLSYFKDFVPVDKNKDPIMEIDPEDGKLKPFTYVSKLMEYKKLTKVRSTYVGVPQDDHGNPTGFWKYLFDGKIYPSYHLSKTLTGRTNSLEPNGQNIPKRGRYAKMYRKLFKAPKGWTLIQADFSQAELRVAAWQAREPNMIRAYAEGKDLHCVTAASLMGLSYEDFLKLPEDVYELKRYHAKSAGFGLVYGMIASTYLDYAFMNYGITLTIDEAEEHRNAFFRRYPKLLDWHSDTIDFVHAHKFVRALHGAKRSLPDIDSKDFMVRSETERQAINSPVQRFASDLGVMALTRINRDLKRAGKEAPPIKPIMFIHDAIVFAVRDDYVSEAMPAIKWYMENNPLDDWFGLTPPLPIIADIESGSDLASLKAHKNIIASQPCWFTEDLLVRAA